MKPLPLPSPGTPVSFVIAGVERLGVVKGPAPVAGVVIVRRDHSTHDYWLDASSLRLVAQEEVAS